MNEPSGHTEKQKQRLAALEDLDLSDDHKVKLTIESAISPQVIAVRGYHTILKDTQVAKLGFTGAQARAPALVVPVWSVRGYTDTCQIRPDKPRLNKEGKYVKYELPKGREMLLDVPPASWAHIGDPRVDLFVTEGIRKGDAGVSFGLTMLALLGVWNFRGVNEDGGLTALADWEYVAFKGPHCARNIFIVFDSDVMLKRPVWAALNRFWRLAKDRGANPYLIYLPEGKNRAKQGLDDWLATLPENTTPEQVKWLLREMATDELRPLPKSEKDQERDAAFPGNTRGDYELGPDGLYHYRQTMRGEVRVHVANFRARILKSITRDDGVTTEHWVEVEASRNHHYYRGLMRHAEFDSMNWTEKLMTAAAVLPGNGNREHAAYGIKQLSEPIEEDRMLAHTGWKEDVRVLKADSDDEYETVRAYLHAGGAIGARGAVPGVSMDTVELGAFRLPDPPDVSQETGRQQLQAAILTSLSFLEVADRRQTWPVLTSVYSAPFATIFPCDFTIWMEGGSGGRKSTAAALAACHFGTFTRNTLPGNFKGTPIGIETQASELKDTLFVVDDFNPSVDRKEAARQEAIAHHLVRAVGDSQGRTKGTKEGGKTVSRPPRCLALVTSELPVPGGESTGARTFMVTWEKERVNDKRLAEATAKDGVHYAVAMAGYLQWLAGKLDKFRPQFQQDIHKLREWMPGGHGRIKENAAKLAVGAGTFLLYAREAGAITEEQREALYNEMVAALAAVAETTSEARADRKPTAMFLEFVRNALRSGGGYLAEPKAGGCPAVQHGRWGWTRLRQGEFGFRDGAEKIGWVDVKKGLVYLLPGVAYRLVVKHAQQMEIRFPDRPESLGAALAREGLLARQATISAKKPGDEPKKRTVYYAHVEGGNEPVWCIAVESLYTSPPADEVDDDQSREAAEPVAEPVERVAANGEPQQDEAPPELPF